jgi:hypothetical protein
LSLDLGLGSSDSLRGVRVDEATAELAVLERGRLSRADTETRSRYLSTASRGTVGIVDASTSDELGGVALADVAGAGVVGGDLSESNAGDWTDPS